MPVEYFSAHADGVKVRGPEKEKYTDILCVTAPGIDQAYEWAWTQLGKPYDYSAILGIAFNRNWRENDSWFCSELVAAAFEAVGKPLLNPAVVLYRITPRDILLSPVVSAVQGAQ